MPSVLDNVKEVDLQILQCRQFLIILKKWICKFSPGCAELAEKQNHSSDECSEQTQEVDL